MPADIPVYSPKSIEPKWQAHWLSAKPFHAEIDKKKPKFYGLVEFPYPSGVGLHVGHPRPYTAMDIICRKKRMQGYNVLFPMGWDAFGLPTENYAIKTNTHPAVITQRNVDRFRGQLQMLGYSLDWAREVDTTDPTYYHWTQWIFLQLFKHGLAYKSHMAVNFCPSCKVGLANEEVVDGVCERCGGQVERRMKEQWMLRITSYAQKLLDGLDEVDYIERAKAQQRNWIGRSEGAEVIFRVQESGEELKVFTTRPDTLFGATYMVLSPEHPLIDALKGRIENFPAVEAYRREAGRKSDFERTELQKDKTGVPLAGLSAVNPVTGSAIPLWTSDYVLMGYGTGAIMAVPGHDERDWAFARAFHLPVVEVVAGGNVQDAAFTDIEDGVMVNSGFLNGMRVPEAKKAITAWLAQKALGEPKVNFKLRDWVFSRQRYWGEPIPLVKCDKCGWVPLPEESLPLLLPAIDNFQPGENGESPLGKLSDWINTTCPHCGGPAQRETDTMPQWAGSSWYFLRYVDPHCETGIASKEALEYWMNVDWYNGGMEHTTLHLLYSRFWHRFLFDIGAVNTREPYAKRTSHGMILGETGEKMSKSRGNVINPDDIVDELGADALRLYIMFMGAFDQPIPWSTQSARGCRRFLERVWRLQAMVQPGKARAQMLASLHQAIKKVSEDIERMKFNTAIAQMMTFVNEVYDSGAIASDELRTLLLLLCPFTPHICEEMWELQGYPGHIYEKAWPQHDEKALKSAEVEIAVQVMGKVRARIMVPTGLSQEQAQELVLAHPDVAPLLAGMTLRKFIYVTDRNCNIVAS